MIVVLVGSIAQLFWSVRPQARQMFMWPQKRHWALVLLPFGEPFTARLVDDFVHNAEHCFSAEVPSSRLFLVYEMLLEVGPIVALQMYTNVKDV